MPVSATLSYQPPSPPTEWQVARKWLIRLGVVAGVLVVAIVFFVIGIGISDARKRQARYQQCIAHLPLARAAIAGDARFSHVQIDPHRKYGVLLWLSGTVADIHDRDALQKIIESTRPPVGVQMSVTIDPALSQTPTTGPAVTSPALATP